MRFPGVYGERCATGYQADISKRLVKGGMNRIKDIKMRFTSALALLAAGALPLGYAAAPPIAHVFEKSHAHSPSKAKRKRAEQSAIPQALRRARLLPQPRVPALPPPTVH